MMVRFAVSRARSPSAARDGEAGRLVRSRLGRTCPPPSARWREAQERAAAKQAQTVAARRAHQELAQLYAQLTSPVAWSPLPESRA